LQGYGKDNTATRASDDKRKSKERDCRVNFPHPISRNSASPSHLSHFCNVFLCSPLRVLKSGPEIPAVFSLLWGSSGTSKKAIGVETKKELG
jgi:hypothetical protein